MNKTVMPIIHPEKCNACGLCIGVCPQGALMLIDNVLSITETPDCDWCGECEAVCPLGAVCCPFEIVIEQ